VLIVGGLAMQHYGSDRLTGDVDVAAGRVLAGLAPVRDLTFGGVAAVTPAGLPVDLIVRNDVYADLFDEAIFAGVRVPDLPAPVVRPEYLVAMKMVAGRGKDWLDLEALLALGVVDLARARAVVGKHLGPFAVQEFDRIVEEVAWRTSGGGPTRRGRR
jgi:hypothetical protein